MTITNLWFYAFLNVLTISLYVVETIISIIFQIS